MALAPVGLGLGVEGVLVVFVLILRRGIAHHRRAGIVIPTARLEDGRLLGEIAEAGRLLDAGQLLLDGGAARVGGAALRLTPASTCGPLISILDRAAAIHVGGAFRLEAVGPEPRRLVKIFMRRDCSIGVGRRDVLDSGWPRRRPGSSRAGAGRAERCSCLGGCVLRDNALGIG
jgi:hypothetical protein